MMQAFLYGLMLQCKLDIRSKSLLVTCYIVPLIFFVLMGGIFTSIMPEMKLSLIPSMIVMGVSMGSFIGLPPSIIETYGSDIKRSYRANGIPIAYGLLMMIISTFIHLMILCAIIVLLAPLLFEATLPSHLPIFFFTLSIYIMGSISVGSVLGLIVKNQAKLTMVAQLVFLPSIMLSGIMFPLKLLPQIFQTIGKIFPAFWGYRLLLNDGFRIKYLAILIFIILVFGWVCRILLEKQKIMD